ncbi:MAG: flippase-like domain-containing protein, partial [Proteobacteria bacterium]|nr:flippase-like domain-containing protein [Pseudomonadota bacterium]
IFVFLGMLLNIAVSALKWQILLAIHGINYQFGKLTGYYLAAGFFSNFLPGTIGGDGYRIYKTYQNSHSKTGAILSVFTERLVGFMVLLALGLCGSVGSFLLQGDRFSLFGIIFGSLGLLTSTILVGFLSLKRIQTWALKKRNMPQKIKIFIRHLGDYRRHPTKFLHFITVSIFFYILLFSYRLLLIHALGESCPFFSLVMVVMVSTVLAALPISLNGIGILEGSFIYLISQYGVAYESALMVMVLHRMLSMVTSLIGGVLYYFDREPKPLTAQLREGIQSIKEPAL